MQLPNHFRNENHGDHRGAMPTWPVTDWLICCGLCQQKGDHQMKDELLRMLRQQAHRLRGVVGAWSNDQLKWMGT
jgi:hypothetical protein